MPTKYPAFLFYPKDWLSSPSVTVMSLQEQGAYIRLLAYCWDGGCELPNNTRMLCDLSGMEKERAADSYTELLSSDGKKEEVVDDDYKASMETILAEFQVHPDDDTKITNLKLLTLWREQDERREKKSKAGKEGADARWHRHDPANSEEIANDGSSTPSSSSLPSSSSSPNLNNVKNPPTPQRGAMVTRDSDNEVKIKRGPELGVKTEGFKRWYYGDHSSGYLGYPRKVGVADACKAYVQTLRKAIKSGKTKTDTWQEMDLKLSGYLIQCAKIQMDELDGILNREKTHIPYPATYLRGEQFRPEEEQP